MRVLLHYSAGPAWQRKLAGLAAQRLVVDCCDELDDERFNSLLPQADVLWHVLRPVSAADIEKASRLRLIQKIGVGVNTIDLEAARSRGIAVCNMPGTNTRAVVEMTLLLMLACLRRLPFLNDETRGGRGWQIDRSLQDNLGEIGGRTVGLVGYGAVSRALTPILQAMGARVIYSAREPKQGVDLVHRNLDGLLRESDIVSLHLPLTVETSNLLNKERLALLRPHAILINTARGSLVDQDALVDALRNGRIGAAGLDVFGEEPISNMHALLTLSNVVVTPHLAWLTGETLSRSLGVAVENCSRLRDARELIHRVV